MEDKLQRTNRLSLVEHFEKAAADQWEETAKALKEHHPFYSECFRATAELQRLYEKCNNKWHNTPIYGYKNVKRTRLQIEEVWRAGLTKVGQLFRTGDNGMLDPRETVPEVRELGALSLIIAMNLSKIVEDARKEVFRDKTPPTATNLETAVLSGKQLSQIFQKAKRSMLDSDIGRAPSYATRLRDGVRIPREPDFDEAYLRVWKVDTASKTREVAFQILNRTTWTQNKAFKSGITEDRNCELCNQRETMEHIIMECEEYSEPMWAEVEYTLGALARIRAADAPERIRISDFNVIFNMDNTSAMTHLTKKQNKVLQEILQELKRSILYRRMNRGQRRQNIQKIQAHLIGVYRKLSAFKIYKGQSQEN